MRRVILVVILAILAFLAAGIAFLWTPDTEPAEMIAVYSGEEARWAETSFQDYRVHYQVAGPEGAPTVILIHGTSDSFLAWEEVRPELEKSYRVIAYDQPGHGLTGPHPERDYSFEGMKLGLDAVMKATGTEKAVLVGNSMGGWVAWRMALAEPDKVSALVLIDPAGAPLEEKAEGALGFTIMRSSLGRAAAQKITPRSIIATSIKQTVADDAVATEEMTDRFHDLLLLPGNRQAMGDQFVAERQDLSDRLAEIEQPTLVIWGSEDQLIPVAAGKVFAERMPNAELLVYEGIGHLPMNEAPKRTADDMMSFLGNALAPQETLAERMEGEWRLISLNGAPSKAGQADRQAGATFTEGRVEGTAGCNSGRAVILSWNEEGYTTDGQFLATKMLCRDLMEQEALLFAILSKGQAGFDGETLVMAGPDGGEARFERL
jgi:pimeloyl-ACP methyl ester carboxylesterase